MQNLFKKTKKTKYNATKIKTINIPEPHQGQVPILAAIRGNAKYIVISCGRRWGKTQAAIDLVIEYLLAGKRVHWFAPKYKTLKEAMLQIRDIITPLGYTGSVHDARFEVKGPNGTGVIVFWSLTDPDAGRSTEGELFIFDEAAMVKNLAEIFERAVRPMALKGGAKFVFISSPRGRDFFHAIWHRGWDAATNTAKTTGLWRCFQAPSWDNPMLDDDERLELEEAIKEGMLDPLIYRREYLAEFVEDAGKILSKEDFNILGLKDAETIKQMKKDGVISESFSFDNLKWVRSWDLAMTEKEEGDESVGTLMATDDKNNIFIRNQRYMKAELPDLIPEIIKTMERDGQKVLVGIERPLVGTPVMDFLERDMRVKKYQVIPCEIYGRNKKVRMSGWATRARAKKVFLIKDGLDDEWIEGLIDQALQFTGAKHDDDDRIDSISIGFDMLYNRSMEFQPTQKLERDTYEHFLAQYDAQERGVNLKKRT